MEPIVVKSKLDFKTYYHINLVIYFRARQLVSLSIVFVCLNALILMQNQLNWFSELVCIGTIIGIYGILIPVLSWFKCKRQMSNSPILMKGITYYITNEHIEGVAPESSAKTNWSLIKKVVEKDNYFLLSSSPTAFRYLPKDGFVSATDIEKFKNIVKANNVKAYFK